MPQFILDTSGEVCIPLNPPVSWCPHARNVYLWGRDLDAFTQGYIEALFFTESSPAYGREEWHSEECREAQEEGTADGTLPGDVGFSDLAPEALATILEECAVFQRDNADALREAYDHESGYDETQAGRDYWFTRNGHGVGFWDRGLDDIGDRLSNAARYSEVNTSFEDDGKVHLS